MLKLKLISYHFQFIGETPLSDNTINAGDHVLLCLDSRRNYLIKVEKGKTFHTHKGYINLEELIGKNFGSTIQSNSNITFTALKPILEDYIMKSSRKTQITYPKDAALIVMFSGICSGSQVVESGTGTGALTTALAHYVKPHGKIYTYDVRDEFKSNVEKNLKRANLLEFVEIKHGDVTLGIEEQNLDAVILDLATPWLVIPHAYKSLKPSGILISFSPTIDQVVKTTEVLKDNNFTFIDTIECLMRSMQISRGKTRPHTIMTGHTGYITKARKTIKFEELIKN